MWPMCHHCPTLNPWQTSIVEPVVVTSGYGLRTLLNSWQPLPTAKVNPWIQLACHLQ